MLFIHWVCFRGILLVLNGGILLSTYYYLYAEANVNGKWMSLNPVMQAVDGSFKSSEILYFTHSSMAEVYYALEREMVSRGLPEDCSAGLMQHFHNLDEVTKDDWGAERTWRDVYINDVFVVNYERAIKQKVKKDRPFKYMYYVVRENMAAFQCGEINAIEHWLTHEEYLELDKEERQEYVYFEWNNWWDEYQVFCEIAKRVDTQIAFLEDMVDRLGVKGCYNGISPGQVRLIVHRC